LVSQPFKTTTETRSENLQESSEEIEKACKLATDCMLEEMQGPAGKQIVDFITEHTREFFLTFNTKRGNPPFVSCNKSQFLSFLDVWLDLLKQNKHKQSEANKKFKDWLGIGLTQILGRPENLLCWNEGVLQGFISQFHSKELLKNIVSRMDELNDRSDSEFFSDSPSCCVCFLSLNIGMISSTVFLEGEAVTFRGVSMSEFVPLCRDFFVSGNKSNRKLFKPEGLFVPKSQLLKKLEPPEISPRYFRGVDGVFCRVSETVVQQLLLSVAPPDSLSQPGPLIL